MSERHMYELLGSLILYIQVFHQNKILITEQQVNDTNPLQELANIT